MTTRRRTFSRHPKAILFDMDGVIVDSMPYHFISWYEALRPYDISVKCFDVYQREGEQWAKALRELWRPSGKPLTLRITREVFKAKDRIFRKYFKRSIFHSVEEILPCLRRQGYMLGLVTGTTRKEMVRILPAKLRNLFSSIVTGDAVKRGKPFPDPYLKAAKELNLTAEDCVVVENAPYGIRAAKAARMFCIALTTSLPSDYLSQADIIIDDIKEITHIFPTCKSRL
jgi:beta-phosphoglucomutase